MLSALGKVRILVCRIDINFSKIISKIISAFKIESIIKYLIFFSILFILIK